MTAANASWWLLVIALGGLGAAARYIVDTLLRERTGLPAAVTTAIINALGSFAVGLLARPAFDAGMHLGQCALAVGFLGGFTTYSTAMVDTWQLWQRGRRAAAVWNTVGQYLGCALVAIAGFHLAGWWPGSH